MECYVSVGCKEFNTGCGFCVGTGTPTLTLTQIFPCGICTRNITTKLYTCAIPKCSYCLCESCYSKVLSCPVCRNDMAIIHNVSWSKKLLIPCIFDLTLDKSECDGHLDLEENKECVLNPKFIPVGPGSNPNPITIIQPNPNPNPKQNFMYANAPYQFALQASWANTYQARVNINNVGVGSGSGPNAGSNSDSDPSYSIFDDLPS